MSTDGQTSIFFDIEINATFYSGECPLFSFSFLAMKVKIKVDLLPLEQQITEIICKLTGDVTIIYEYKE